MRVLAGMPMPLVRLKVQLWVCTSRVLVVIFAQETIHGQ